MQPCLFCGGDASEPGHLDRCDGRQGWIEAESDEPITTTITVPRETSVMAFYNAVNTGMIRTRREQVWAALHELGIATSNEVCAYLKERRHVGLVVDSNTCARMTELCNLGLVREIGTRPCRVTKQTCITWAIVALSDYAGGATVQRCPLCQHIISTEVPAITT